MVMIIVVVVVEEGWMDGGAPWWWSWSGVDASGLRSEWGRSRSLTSNVANAVRVCLCLC